MFDYRFIMRWLGIIALIVIMIFTVVPTLALVTTTSFNVTCESVTFAFTNDSTSDNDYSNLTILVNDTPVYVSSPFDFGPSEINFTYPLNLSGGQFKVEIIWETPPYILKAESTVQCGGVVEPEESEAPETPLVVNGRMCFAPGEVASAVFFYNSHLDIYSIQGKEGMLSLRLTSDELAEFPAIASGDVLIAEVNNMMPTYLYRRTDGNLRIVVGPEPLEGKIYECVIAPGSCALSRSWLPGQEPSSALDPTICT